MYVLVFHVPLFWLTLKHGVPHWCSYWCIASIWTSFWNILMSYFIYLVVKAMEPEWSFVKKLDRGRAWFSCYRHWKFTPEKPNSYIAMSVSIIQVPCCSPCRGRTFTHSYALLRSLVFEKMYFMWNHSHKKSKNSLETPTVLIEIFMLCWNLPSGSNHRWWLQKKFLSLKGISSLQVILY